jgi:hypothetical protein
MLLVLFCGRVQIFLWLFFLAPYFEMLVVNTQRNHYMAYAKDGFFMPTVSAVTTTAGYFLASKVGLITLQSPTSYWIFAVLSIVTVMMVLGLGIFLPTNLRVYFEIRKDKPDMSKIQRLMKKYVKVVAIQAVLQFTIIFIMAEFATGFSLHL